jgi:hypothetical protein
MDATAATWEGLADSHHDFVGLDDPPVNALEQAVALGLTIRLGGQRPCVLGSTLYLPKSYGLNEAHTHGTVAHECGHKLLQYAGEEDCEDGASYLAGALMLPRRGFDRDVSRMAWSLPELRAKHLNASAEMIAHRICQTRDAVATVFDQGKQTKRLASAWIGERFGRRASRWERDLANRCYETGEPVRGDDLVYAWPVFTGVHRRVVLIAEAEQLSLRF